MSFRPRPFGGSGVCGAIFDAAGYDDMVEACKKIGRCDYGDAVVTPAFKLRAKYHAFRTFPKTLHNICRALALQKLSRIKQICLVQNALVICIARSWK